MQLRKPATAILALALSAGLAQADDAAPAHRNERESGRSHIGKAFPPGPVFPIE